MFDTSATYVDVKVFNGNEVLFHWVFRAYRSDPDLSVQQQFCDEVLIRTANEGWFRPSVIISVFVGWKVSVTSFEIGARVYTIGPPVVASDHATSTCELRVTLGRPVVQRGLWQRRRSGRVPVPRCQQPDRPQVRANVRAGNLAICQPHLWACIDQYDPGLPSAAGSCGRSLPRPTVRSAFFGDRALVTHRDRRECGGCGDVHR